MTLHRILSGLAAACASLVLLCVPAGGGPSADHAGQSLGTPVNAVPVLYRLSPPSTYINGCFEPCLCPVQFVEEVRGTFKRSPMASSSNTVRRWRISEVNWHVPLGNGIRVTGSGVYSVGSPFPITLMMHRLELDLAVGDQQTQRFDSGWLPLTNAADLTSVTIDVSMNGMVCFDTVFEIDAAPVPANEIRPYVLVNSQFLEGCYDPCDCLLLQRGLFGTMNMVSLDGSNTSPHRSWAVTDVQWLIGPGANSPAIVGPRSRVTGYGIYTRGPSGNTQAPSHRMIADLFVAQNTPERYDSGNVPAPPQTTPATVVDIAIANNGFECFNRVFDLVGVPVSNSPALSPAAVAAP